LFFSVFAKQTPLGQEKTIFKQKIPFLDFPLCLPFFPPIFCPLGRKNKEREGGRKEREKAGRKTKFLRRFASQKQQSNYKEDYFPCEGE
jgi:hypothetical protein